MNHLSTSVIIPTYNRQAALLRTLESLSVQSLSSEKFEVVVSDNGSASDEIHTLKDHFPFQLTVLHQQNLGATQARNLGAQNGQGEILVFLDDDISLSTETLQVLTELCIRKQQHIILGTLVIPQDILVSSIYAQISHGSQSLPEQDEYIHYTFCKTGLLAVRRADFFTLGMFHDPTGGWPNWDDVDFGYRAHRAGFRIFQSCQAIGYHWDYSLNDLDTSSQRAWRASKSAARLFQVHPELRENIPMFGDALPVCWGTDPPRIIFRKFARKISAMPFIIRRLRQCTACLERRERLKQNPRNQETLRVLYRWTTGSYVYRGYRTGLHEISTSLPSDNHQNNTLDLFKN